MVLSSISFAYLSLSAPYEGSLPCTRNTSSTCFFSCEFISPVCCFKNATTGASATSYRLGEDCLYNMRCVASTKSSSLRAVGACPSSRNIPTYCEISAWLFASTLAMRPGACDKLPSASISIPYLSRIVFLTLSIELPAILPGIFASATESRSSDFIFPASLAPKSRALYASTALSDASLVAIGTLGSVADFSAWSKYRATFSGVVCCFSTVSYRGSMSESCTRYLFIISPTRGVGNVILGA